MRYRLTRKTDGAGDVGYLWVATRETLQFIEASIDEVQIDNIIRVGSLIARTMQWQDYWTTTPITEVINRSEDSMRFLTRNSEYLLERL